MDSPLVLHGGRGVRLDGVQRPEGVVRRRERAGVALLVGAAPRLILADGLDEVCKQNETDTR